MCALSNRIWQLPYRGNIVLTRLNYAYTALIYIDIVLSCYMLLARACSGLLSSVLINGHSHIELSCQIYCLCARVKVISKLPTDIPIQTLYSMREFNEVIYITSQVMHVMSFCFLSVKYLLSCYPLIPVANIEKRS